MDTGKWETLAWQGVTLRVPPDWNIGAIGGDRTQGYLRVDGPEMPRLEIKWATSKGFVDVAGIVDKYLADLGKKRKRGDPEVKVDREVEVVSKRQMRKKDLTCFGWRAETQGYGAAWYCQQCERSMITQVMAPAGEDGKSLAAEIIAGLEDHPRGGWVRWAVYGMQMQAPEDFRLENQKLMAGLIELSFERQGEQIVGARWGMANVALRNQSLEQWAKAELSQRHKGIKLSFEPTEFREHPALAVSGEHGSPVRRVQGFVMHCLRKSFPEYVRGVVWHCEPTNKLFYVGGLFDEHNVGLKEELAARMICHTDEDTTRRGRAKAGDDGG
jgi:hypothetical protein